MKKLLKVISFSGLLFTAAPAFLVFYRVIDKPIHFVLMLIGTLLWFASVPFWMKGTSLE